MANSRWPSAVSRAAILVMSAVLLAVGGCSSKSEPAGAERPRFRPADEAAPAETADASGGRDATSTQAGRNADVPLDVGAAVPAASAASAAKAGGAPARPDEPGAPAGLRELLAQIDSLGAKLQEQTNLEGFVQIEQLRLAACNKALAMNPDQGTRQSLIAVIYSIYRELDQVHAPRAQEQLAAFARSISADADPEIARLGRHIGFDANMRRLLSQQSVEGKAILAEVEALVAAEKENLSEETFDLLGQAPVALLQVGFENEAQKCMELLTSAAATNPQLADRGKLQQVDFARTRMLLGQKGAENDLVAAVKTVLSQARPSREVFASLQRAATYAEMLGHMEAASACYDMIEPAFAGAGDPQLEQAVARMIAGGRKRMGLVGQPFVVEGVTLDGKPFDWSAYQGKVVLVDFWATWCGPCLAELPNIRANYEQFHALGFEVVGVNVNTDLRDVQQFFSVQELPWTTVTSQVVLDNKAGEDWTALPMAAKCGVDAIPFLVLVGKDGKVDSLHVRGPKLKARLAQLLGEPPAAEIPADPTAPRPAVKQEGQKTGGRQPAGPPSPVALHLSQAVLGVQPTDVPAADDPAINPYQAKPGLSARQLVTFIEKMLDKPKTIQGRSGFTEAIVDACDRVLAADPPPTASERLTAIETKLSILHRDASSGNDAADRQLAAFVEELKGEQPPRIAKEVEFLRLERRVLEAAGGPVEQIGPLLAEVREYVAKEKLTGKHLRLASSTVALINRLADGDAREKHFAEFGALFSKSNDKELARYGRKLARPLAGRESDLVGRPLELAGVTVKGTPLGAESYRGKVVIVDFWATWCGPCRAAMPELKALFEKHHPEGLEIIGVSLDQDQEALAEYLDENEIPWQTLAGEQTQELAEKFNVRAIPTLILADREGKIVAVSHALDALVEQAERLLRLKSAGR